MPKGADREGKRSTSREATVSGEYIPLDTFDRSAEGAPEATKESVADSSKKGFISRGNASTRSPSFVIDIPATVSTAPRKRTVGTGGGSSEETEAFLMASSPSLTSKKGGVAKVNASDVSVSVEASPAADPREGGSEPPAGCWARCFGPKLPVARTFSLGGTELGG